MTVSAAYEFKSHLSGAFLAVFDPAGRTEPAFAAKRNELEVTAVRAGIHGPAKRRVTTMNHLVDIFNDSRTRMEFIIIGKDGL